MLEKIIHFIQRGFAVWILVFAGLSFAYPHMFTFIVPYITWLLGIIMFGMGITLTLADFKEVFTQPRAVFIAVFAQYLLMPFLAFVLAIIFQLPQEIAIGVILVGSCPGGTSSNVMTYLAKGNTALSVSCTTVATLLAPLLTPIMFYIFASKWLTIDAVPMMISILKIVLFPIALGLICRKWLRVNPSKINLVMPIISIIAIIAIVTAVVSISKDKIIQSGLLIFAVVILHNLLGYLSGYTIAKIFRLPLADRKATAIEVGMQNSGLGVALAAVHFKANPIAAVPSAIFSVWHNISGALLAYYWSNKTETSTTSKLENSKTEN